MVDFQARRWLGPIVRGELRHFSAASALALCALCSVDVVRSQEGLSLRSWLLLGLFGAVFGALHGLIMRAVLRPISRAPLHVQTFSALLIGFGVAGWLADSLGTFDRLSGPYRSLALRVLGVCTGAALGIALLFHLLLPAHHAFERKLRGKLAYRLALAVLLFGVAGVCFYADLHLYPGAYPSAHVALRIASLTLASAAFVSITRHGTAPQQRVLRWLWVAAAVALPLLGMLWPIDVDDLIRGNWSVSLVRIARNALDFDRDGYAGLLGGGDCNDFNPRVHPGAREIPGNGVDDNCLLGDAKPRPHTEIMPAAAVGTSPYDVVLITVDSLRPDHLGILNPKEFGPQARGTSPNIDAWAAQSAVTFEHAYSTGGWTSISLASMMRGLYPRRLAWTRHYETLYHRLVREDEVHHLPYGETVLQMFPLAWRDPHPTLAALFQRRGMQTGAVVHDGFSQMLTHGIGVEDHFDHYREVEFDIPQLQEDAGSVTLAERELATMPRDRRFFLWVHIFGIHSVNEYHPGYRVYGPTQRDAYDHELRYFDSLWPRLWGAIQRRGGPIVTVLTSDHGEVFAEPIRMHGFSITEDDIRVPMFVNAPGVHPKRVSQLVSTIDLFPTLLGLTHTPAPARIDGIDLTPYIFADAPLRPRKLIAETWRYTSGGSPIVDYIAAVDGQHKVVLNNVDQTYRAFDVRKPPESALRIDATNIAPLRHFLDQYVDETGGSLDPAQ